MHRNLQGNAPYAEIMRYARAHGQTGLTHDLDFGATLAAAQGEKPSVVQIRGDAVSPEAIGARVVLALAKWRPNLQVALLTIERERTRLRLLPLRARS